MREIKFRAWNKFEMIYPNHSLTTGTILQRYDNIMQYTGIIDKNGEEIYENDRIKDLMTGMEYMVKIGFCKKHGFVGVYCENEDGYQIPLNGDYDTNKNNNIEIL